MGVGECGERSRDFVPSGHGDTLTLACLFPSRAEGLFGHIYVPRGTSVLCDGSS